MVYIHKTNHIRTSASMEDVDKYFRHNLHDLEREVIIPHCIEEFLLSYKERRILVNVMGLNEANIEYFQVYGYVINHKYYLSRKGNKVILTETIPKNDYEEVRNLVLHFYNINKPVVINE